MKSGEMINTIELPGDILGKIISQEISETHGIVTSRPDGTRNDICYDC